MSDAHSRALTYCGQFVSSPAKKVMLCNVPPFISDEAIGKELSRYGRMVSPIKKIPPWLLDISLGPALRGRVIPVFLSDRGRTRPNPAGVVSPCGRGPAGRRGPRSCRCTGPDGE
ncbi:hypothetical protein QTP70_012056 [Hemibagrus guttatus]|uniref:RNA-binding protein n=1 Tax=Hemibagrus guttatus TaxID=175788 RepID=A0AAE0QZA2_9TELE|nr:hypothetical protein QTP70_012056 [Hemibagrus guttatus]